MVRIAFVVLMVVVEVCLLGSRPTAPPPPPAPVTAAVGATATPPPLAVVPHKLDLPRLQAEVQKLRGLKFKRPVGSDTQTKQQIRRYLERELDEDTNWPKDSLVVTTFGFAPPTFKLRDFVIKFYTEQVAGYYDYKTKMFHMAEDDATTAAATAGLNGGAVQDSMVIHEMDHALQDQFFDLRRLNDEASRHHDNDDYALAISSLLEGDATVVMMDSLLSMMGLDPASRPSLGAFLTEDLAPMSGGPLFDSAPTYFKRMAMFPYLSGAAFVDYYKQRGGWQAVNPIYAHPPTSSHEILHPQDYARQPLWIGHWSHEARPPGWRVGADNVLGEERMRLLWEQYDADDSERNRWSDGWGGDAFRIYTRGEQRFLVWYSVWKTPQDADRFRGGMTKTLLAKDGVKIPPKGRATKSGCVYSIGQRQNAVVVLEGVPQAQAAAVEAMAWGSIPQVRELRN